MGQSSIRRSSVRGSLAAALLLAACGGEPPATGTAQDDIIGGFPATSAKLNAIGALGISDGGGGFKPACTGTLISPTIVLTAKHCVTDIAPDQLVFLIGPNAFSPIRTVGVRGTAVEPTTSGGLIGFGSDVGVVHLATPVTDVPLLPVAAMTDSRIGTRLTAVGYGVQNTDQTFGTRQSGSMTVKANSGPVFVAIFGTFANFVQNGAPRLFPDLDPTVPADLAELQQEFDGNPLLTGLETWVGGVSGDAQSCTGDGGGPLTAKVGSQTTVFGVSSWNFGSNAECTLDGSAFASINPVSLDFIDYETHCPLVPRAGTCEGLTVALRCAAVNEGGRRELRTDCADLDQICGTDENGAVGCIDDPCDGLPPEGTCNGDVATRCSGPGEGDRHVVTTDCGAQGQVCEVDNGAVGCVTPEPVCAHDRCVIGGALQFGCDECVTSICSVDSFCCNVAWDSICVSEVASVCQESCAALEPTPPDPRRP